MTTVTANGSNGSQRRFTVLFDPRDPQSGALESPDTPPRQRMKRPALALAEEEQGSDMGSEDGSIRATPHPDARREGFTWEVPEEDDMQVNHGMRRPSASEPKGTANPSKYNHLRVNFDMSKMEMKDKSSPLVRRTSSNLFEKSFGRADTFDSMSSLKQQQQRRAVPDIGVFNLGNTPQGSPLKEPAPKSSKLGRNLSMMITPLKKRNSAGSTFSRSSFSKKIPRLNAAQGKTPKPKKEKKLGLKDRRGMAQNEAIRLTLPMQLPDLPQRTRSPFGIPDTVQMAEFASPRRHSPKTPWVRDKPPNWLEQDRPSPVRPNIVVQPPPDETQVNTRRSGEDARSNDPAPPARPPAKLRRSLPKLRPLFTRGQLYLRNSVPADSVDAKSQAASATLRSASTPNTNSNRWPNTDLQSPASLLPAGSPSPQLSPHRAVSPRLTRMFKEPPGNTPGIALTAASTPTLALATAKPQPSSTRFKKQSLATMPAPPTFIPPEVHRVPTPPIFAENGEVRGKLAGFFFDPGTIMMDMPITGHPKTSAAPPTGNWDSDAVLMSQDSGITPSDSDSHERDSPTRLSALPTPRFSDRSPIAADYATMSATGYVYTPFPRANTDESLRPPSVAESGGSHPDFFRLAMDRDDSPSKVKKSPEVGLGVGLDADGNERELTDKERAKLEWILAEHLPNSPLCPIHWKYRGSLDPICP